MLIIIIKVELKIVCVLGGGLPVEVRGSCVLVGQLQPWIGHHLMDIGTLVGIRLEKLLQKTDGSCERETENRYLYAATDTKFAT